MDESWWKNEQLVEYVVLLHDDYEDMIVDYSKNPNKYLLGPCIWHYEPLSRYRKDPPRNHKWKLYKVVKGPIAAQELIEETEKPWFEKAFAMAKNELMAGNTLSSRYQILKRDGFKCRVCGRGADDGVKLEVDHRVPKSKGGKDTADNLWTLCFDCNRGKSNRDVST